MLNAQQNEALNDMYPVANQVGQAIAVDSKGRPIVSVTVPAPSTSAATFLRAAIAFGSVAAALTSVITNSNQIRFIRIRNTTDQPVDIAFNGTTVNIDSIPAGASEFYDFGADGRDIRTDVYLKYTSVAPASGTVYINAFY